MIPRFHVYCRAAVGPTFQGIVADSAGSAEQRLDRLFRALSLSLLGGGRQVLRLP